jgi:hypothetical protein
LPPPGGGSCRYGTIALSIFFIWFYGASTWYKSYGAETGKMVMANIGVINFKATPGVKTTSPAGAMRCIDIG